MAKSFGITAAGHLAEMNSLVHGPGPGDSDCDAMVLNSEQESILGAGNQKLDVLQTDRRGSSWKFPLSEGRELELLYPS